MSLNGGSMSERSWAWADRARCAGQEWELFFGPSEGWRETRSERAEREATAKKLCARCPVRRECLEKSLEEGHQYGVWGGLTEEERRQERRDRKEIQRGAVRVSAVGAMRRLRALACAGHGVAQVVEATGVSESMVSAIRAGRQTAVFLSVAVAIKQAYPMLLAAPAGRAHAQVRQVAVSAGWHSAQEWAGVDMDDPAASPAGEAA